MGTFQKQLSNATAALRDNLVALGLDDPATLGKMFTQAGWTAEANVFLDSTTASADQERATELWMLAALWRQGAVEGDLTLRREAAEPTHWRVARHELRRQRQDWLGPGAPPRRLGPP